MSSSKRSLRPWFSVSTTAASFLNSIKKIVHAVLLGIVILSGYARIVVGQDPRRQDSEEYVGISGCEACEGPQAQELFWFTSRKTAVARVSIL